MRFKLKKRDVSFKKSEFHLLFKNRDFFRRSPPGKLRSCRFVRSFVHLSAGQLRKSCGVGFGKLFWVDIVYCETIHADD